MVRGFWTSKEKDIYTPMTLADEIAQAVIEKLGYVVIPYHKDMVPAIGKVVNQFGQLPVSQPFVIVSETDRADYLQQKSIASRWIKPLDPRFPKGYVSKKNSQIVEFNARYFRAITD